MPIITLNSQVFAHYPCDPNMPDITQVHLPRFFWTNAIPDADIVVDLSINGTPPPAKGLTEIAEVTSTFQLPDGATLDLNVTTESITNDKVVRTRAVGLTTGKAFIDEFSYGLLFG
ncbi:hypothetical protein BKA67DRAFT_532764 [Truncatella angustata]|uniref:Uncharacterized protein n=1 Tax=Truncatella angustata TaxID=152316 RepID=A0A9P8USR2_9PEZI|nr:uncharacterized protein BKA67DRAFT_532764 [Truncatella angustata]KAH6657563.1 hypothetical protein BKA67DRAFT_532764 [Truncatella angustata]